MRKAAGFCQRPCGFSWICMWCSNTKLGWSSSEVTLPQPCRPPCFSETGSFSEPVANHIALPGDPLSLPSQAPWFQVPHLAFFLSVLEIKPGPLLIWNALFQLSPESPGAHFKASHAPRVTGTSCSSFPGMANKKGIQPIFWQTTHRAGCEIIYLRGVHLKGLWHRHLRIILKQVTNRRDYLFRT